MCGIAAFVEVAAGAGRPLGSLAVAEADVEAVLASGLEAAGGTEVTDTGRAAYAGGSERIDRLTEWARGLKRTVAFADLALGEATRRAAGGLAERLRRFADDEDARLQAAPLA